MGSPVKKWRDRALRLEKDVADLRVANQRQASALRVLFARLGVADDETERRRFMDALVAEDLSPR